MKSSGSRLRVCVDARLATGLAGGVEQFVIGLASGLSKLTDGDEEYLFLAYADADAWIRPYLSGPCRLLHASTPSRPPAWRRAAGRLPFVKKAWHALSPLAGRSMVRLSKSDGTVEGSGAEIMHFTSQGGFLTDVASIYHPWDLQHLHLPQFFDPRQRLAREVLYRAFCDQATVVSVASRWCQEDLMRHYGLPEEKVQVVPMAPVLSAYPVPTREALAATRAKFALPEAFVFYPAQTWAHKNHLGLLEALAILRDRYGLRAPLVCSGHTNSFFPAIQKRARALRLDDQARFLGFITPLELQCLYKLCRCMVFPTKFEGWGMPLMEAFLAGTPVASSSVTSLPEQAGDAALIFDPDRPEEMAAAIRRLWTDEATRTLLAERGKKNVERFTWERTARLFRAHYRRIANRLLAEEDRALLVEAAYYR